jgi:hypothetical protein
MSLKGMFLTELVARSIASSAGCAPDGRLDPDDENSPAAWTRFTSDAVNGIKDALDARNGGDIQTEHGPLVYCKEALIWMMAGGELDPVPAEGEDPYAGLRPTE